jgi:hypothetical protein
MNAAGAPFARFINDYDALVQVLRDRSEQMEIARLELDRLTGLADGYAGKVLGPTKIKSIGTSLGPLLQTLGLILIAVEDPAARDRTLARRTPFDASNRRMGNHCNSTKAETAEGEAPTPVAPRLVHDQPAARESASRSHLRVIEPRVKSGGPRWGTL